MHGQKSTGPRLPFRLRLPQDLCRPPRHFLHPLQYQIQESLQEHLRGHRRLLVGVDLR